MAQRVLQELSFFSMLKGLQMLVTGTAPSQCSVSGLEKGVSGLSGACGSLIQVAWVTILGQVVIAGISTFTYILFRVCALGWYPTLSKTKFTLGILLSTHL